MQQSVASSLGDLRMIAEQRVADAQTASAHAIAEQAARDAERARLADTREREARAAERAREDALAAAAAAELRARALEDARIALEVRLRAESAVAVVALDRELDRELDRRFAASRHCPIVLALACGAITAAAIAAWLTAVRADAAAQASAAVALATARDTASWREATRAMAVVEATLADVVVVQQTVIDHAIERAHRVAPGGVTTPMVVHRTVASHLVAPRAATPHVPIVLSAHCREVAFGGC